MHGAAEQIKTTLVIKGGRNVRRGYQAGEEEHRMYPVQPWIWNTPVS